MSASQYSGLAFFGLFIAVWAIAEWRDRPKRNRRVTLPPPFRDSRDSIRAFRDMYK